MERKRRKDIRDVREGRGEREMRWKGSGITGGKERKGEGNGGRKLGKRGREWD